MKIIIKLFICISLIFTPFFAFAGAAENWEIVENVYDQPKNTVNVTAKKITQDAANSGVYKVQVPVNASTLGNTLKRMLWVGASVSAITAMVEGVGWIIDTGSQVIKKPKQNQPDSTQQYYWISLGWNQTKAYSASASADLAASVYCATYGYGTCIVKNFTVISLTQVSFSIYRTNGSLVGDGFQSNRQTNPNYDPSVPVEYEIVSDAAVGNEALGNGTEPKSNTSPSSPLIADAYNPNNPVSDAPAPKQTNKALDSANPQPEPTPTNPDPDADTGSATPKPNVDTDGDGQPDDYSASQPSAGTQFTLPNFCGWAPAVCDWFTWTKQNDDLPQDEKPEISQIPTPELKEDAVRWSAQCPADAQVPINMQGVSSTITFSWSPWCQLLSMIKPAIVVSAYIGAAFIVLGLRT